MNSVLEHVPIEALRSAVDVCVSQRTKMWLGACWYRQDTQLYLDWDVETIIQTAELLKVKNSEAEWILKLLKASGKHLVFATYVDDDSDRGNNTCDEEEFDEEGWLIGESSSKRQHVQSNCISEHKRYLGLLSGNGLRLQTDLILYDGMKPVFFPIKNVPILADYAVIMARRYEQKGLKQIRFCLQLKIFYLLSFQSTVPPMWMAI